ncbi:MAG: redoxin domain-containing protein [Gemmatales bacterium]|nr:redoxin domain-containing protein [Gemmatales bacterium]MDW8386055.1 redoxin domain-containing protein [Gemmatales bacterium]
MTARMRLRLFRLVAWLSVAGLVLLGSASPSLSSTPGQVIEDFSLTDINGKSWSLQANGGKKATVLVFVSTECPMSNAYLSGLVEMAKAYEPKGVAFAAINANREEDPKLIAAHAREFGVTFPVLLDPKQIAVQKLQPAVNPEAFVLDAERKLRYRGRIDNAYSARLVRNPQVTRHDLREALDEILAGKPVSVPVTKAFGCAIEPLRDATSDPKTSEITFYRDVLPILQEHCQGCHRPGEVGPFSLMTYRQAVKWGEDIRTYTDSRKMPPWKPTNPAGWFRNERHMSDEAIKTLARWVDAGMPEGDPKDAPPPRRFPEGWQLGEPDLVLTVPEEMTIGPSGPDLFRVFVLPTGLTEDKYVSAIEVRPGNKRVVHHTLNFIDTLGRGRRLEEAARKRPRSADEQDYGPGYTVQMGIGFFPPSGSLAGWAPGNLTRPLPEGVGYFLPKNSDVVVQVHYHRTGKVEKDQLRIGLYFSKTPVKERLQPIVLPGPFLVIPPGEANFVVRGAIRVNQPVTLYQITPHMHLLGRKIRADVTFPDGQRLNLINIDDWDYNWQETYIFHEPIRVPEGSVFSVEAVFDNSESNPLNPNRPPKPVRFGEQTTDEMCFVFLGATSEKPGRISVSPASGNQP